jgi:hypothetical protein
VANSPAPTKRTTPKKPKQPVPSPAVASAPASKGIDAVSWFTGMKALVALGFTFAVLIAGMFVGPPAKWVLLAIGVATAGWLAFLVVTVYLRQIRPVLKDADRLRAMMSSGDVSELTEYLRRQR